MKKSPLTIKKMVAKNIKKFRARAGLTQEQAAEKADISVAYWQRLELVSQANLPSLPTLFTVANVLDVKPSRLIQE